MAWCLPEAEDNEDDGEKGFALSSVVKRKDYLGKFSGTASPRGNLLPFMEVCS
jgi:hypothetical protein